VDIPLGQGAGVKVDRSLMTARPDRLESASRLPSSSVACLPAISGGKGGPPDDRRDTGDLLVTAGNGQLPFFLQDLIQVGERLADFTDMSLFIWNLPCDTTTQYVSRLLRRFVAHDADFTNKEGREDARACKGALAHGSRYYGTIVLVIE